MVAAALVAVSTLFTKQHYVVDVVGGVCLALGAYAVVLRDFPREKTLGVNRRLASVFALAIMCISGAGMAGAWVVYLLSRVP